MSTRPAPHLGPLALLLVLLVALLSACGANKPAVAPSPMPATQAGALREDTGDTNASAPTPAPAATAAPAAEVPAPLSGATGDTSSAGGLPAATAAATASSGEAAAASEARQRPLGQEAGLKAGEIDDNATFADYLAYLQSYNAGGIRLANVSERYLISVIDDNQRPVIDARVTIYDGDRPIFRSRTYAGGKTIFMPQLFDANNASTFRVVAEYGSSSAELSFERGRREPIELGLRDVAADETLRLDMLFLLDTTGSMEDELTRIQQTIDSIAGRIDAFSPRPQIRYGLVAYRDQGDDYVTRGFDFTPDLATFRSQLAQLSAAGGGDTPEAVDEALYEAVVRSSWSEEPAVRLVFLVADAAPHIDTSSQFTYLDGAREAVSRGVKIYPIAASNTDAPAEYAFRQLAQQTMAGFVFLTYQPGASGGAPGESTTLEAGDQPYTVERLDDLIVSIVERELAAAIGAR